MCDGRGIKEGNIVAGAWWNRKVLDSGEEVDEWTTGW